MYLPIEISCPLNRRLSTERMIPALAAVMSELLPAQIPPPNAHAAACELLTS